MATGDVTELREFDASRLGKVAEIGMFGEQGSGKTRAAQQLVLQNKHRSVCVVSPDTDGTYRALFGTSAVVRDFENKVYRRAEAVIDDHSRTPRAPRIPATRRDSVRILVDRTSEALPSGCWSDMGYLFIGRVSSEAQRALLRYRFSPHNFPEDKWDALLDGRDRQPESAPSLPRGLPPCARHASVLVVPSAFATPRTDAHTFRIPAPDARSVSAGSARGTRRLVPRSRQRRGTLSRWSGNLQPCRALSGTSTVLRATRGATRQYCPTAIAHAAAVQPRSHSISLTPRL